MVNTIFELYVKFILQYMKLWYTFFLMCGFIKKFEFLNM
jgi:hypothetical protein